MNWLTTYPLSEEFINPPLSVETLLASASSCKDIRGLELVAGQQHYIEVVDGL